MFDFKTEEYESLTNSQLKKMADYWLRQYILCNTESKYSKFLCPLKDRMYREEQMDVAHFFDRQIMSLRYDLNNVHLISIDSNRFDAQVVVEGFKSLHHKEYEEYLKSRLSEKEWSNLLDKSKYYGIFAKKDYIERIKFFRHGTRQNKECLFRTQ